MQPPSYIPAAPWRSLVTAVTYQATFAAWPLGLWLEYFSSSFQCRCHSVVPQGRFKTSDLNPEKAEGQRHTWTIASCQDPIANRHNALVALGTEAEALVHKATVYLNLHLRHLQKVRHSIKSMPTPRSYARGNGVDPEQRSYMDMVAVCIPRPVWVVDRLICTTVPIGQPGSTALSGH